MVNKLKVKGLSAFTFTIALIVSLLGVSAHGAEYNINPGLWETTSKMEITGMPPEMAAMMQKAPEVEKECVKDNSFDFDPGDDAKGCTFKTNRQSSNKLNWEIKCSAEGGNASGHGEVDFKGDTLSGWFEMNMQGPTGPMKMRNTFEGRRLGSC